jgi:RNA recognition motif-containing protein
MMHYITKIFTVLLLSTAVVSTASATIYIENLPVTTTESDLVTLFSHYGKVMKVELLKETGTGFVSMGNYSMEQEALQTLNNKKLNGKKIKVSKVGSVRH